MSDVHMCMCLQFSPIGAFFQTSVVSSDPDVLKPRKTWEKGDFTAICTIRPELICHKLVELTYTYEWNFLGPKSTILHG